MKNNNDDFLEYLFVTGQLDEFLGHNNNDDDDEKEDEEDNKKKKVR